MSPTTEHAAVLSNLRARLEGVSARLDKNTHIENEEPFRQRLAQLDERLKVKEAVYINEEDFRSATKDIEAGLSDLEFDLDALEVVDATCVESPWPAPKPLPMDEQPLPKMTPDMIPEPLRAWLVDASKRLEVPLEMVAIPAVVAVGSLVGTRINIYPKRYDESWTEPSIFWGAIIAPSAYGKSPAISEALTHIYRLQGELDAKLAEDRAKSGYKIDILQAQLDVLKKKAGAEDELPPATEHAIEEKQRELAELRLPERHLYIQDATTEKITMMLQDNPDGFLQVRDELVADLKACEKPGRETDRALFLEAYDGKTPLKIGRVGRESVNLRRVALSRLGGIQPGVWNEYIRGAANQGAQADGLVQRFQLMIYIESLPDFTNVDRPRDDAAWERAHAVYRALLDMSPDEVGATRARPDARPALHFAPDAQDRLDAWIVPLMNEVRSQALMACPAYQSHLAKYRTLVARLSLIFHLIGIGDGASASQVSLETVERAIAWVEFLKLHARRIYGDETNKLSKEVRKFAELIKNGAITDGMTLRQVYKKYGSKDQVMASLKVLEDLNWLRIEKQKNPGARSSEVIQLNPALSSVLDVME